MSLWFIKKMTGTFNDDQKIGRNSALLLFVFALSFRLVYILQSMDNPLFGVPVVDAHVYDNWAERMAQGEKTARPFGFRKPSGNP